MRPLLTTWIVPIKFTELASLTELGVLSNSIGFASVTLQSSNYIAVRQQPDGGSPEVIIVDLAQGNNVIKRPIKADSAIMHYNQLIIALKAQERTLQIFNLETKSKLKSTTMNEGVVFWKFFSDSTIGLVTDTSVYHWDIFDPQAAAPTKVFERNQQLSVRV